MFSSVKQSIKKTLNTMGVEVHRFNPESSPLAQFIAALRTFDVDLVIDVGANEGQFARQVRAGGYSGRLVSFEPMQEAYGRLLEFSKGDADWHVHSRCALGDHIGKVELNVAGNSVSSSILPMLDAHASAAPESIFMGREAVLLTTLDEVLPSYLPEAKVPFLKIDTQGYEWHVLDGASAILPKVCGIQMELSLIPLYEGQRLWRECVDRLEAEGFVLWGLQPAFIDLKSGRTLQWDGLFFRQ